MQRLLRTVFTLYFALAAVGTALAIPFPQHVVDSEMAALPARRTSIAGSPPALLVVPTSTADSAAIDERTGVSFSDAAYLYLHEEGRYNLTFIAHVPDANSLQLAGDACRFMSLVWHSTANRVQRRCARLRSRPVDIWMLRTGEPGGEMQNGSIYIYNIGAQRTGIEWARELAHEYGHYLLPSATNFKEPEAWANGVLGERLFLTWLLHDMDRGALTAAALPFTNHDELAQYNARQVQPLLAWAESGLDTATLSRTDTKGFDAFTGMMLYFSATYGPETLFDILEYLPADHRPELSWQDFLHAFTQWVSGQSGFVTRLGTQHETSVYIPAGQYQLTVESGSGPIWAEGLELHKSGATVTANARKAGWFLVSLQKPGTLQWKRI